MNLYIKYLSSSTVRTLAIVSALILGGCAQIERAKELPVRSAADMPHNRVLVENFKKANPGFADADFSGVGIMGSVRAGVCTANIISPGNLLATAYHCIRKEKGVTYQFFSVVNNRNERQRIKVTLYERNDTGDLVPFDSLAVDRNNDIALIKIDPDSISDVTPLSIMPNNDPNIYVAGNSAIFNPELTVSRNSCLNFQRVGHNLSAFCDVSIGDSGGAIFSIHQGKLVLRGIVKAIWGDFKIDPKEINQVFATHVSALAELCYTSFKPESCRGFGPQNKQVIPTHD